MANFAIIENGIVVNTIICDSKEIAEKLTGSTCVEYVDDNYIDDMHPIHIGCGYDGKTFSPAPEVIIDEVQPTE